VPAGKVVEEPVINTDWLPTLLQLAGQSVPTGLDGISFAAGLTGRGSFPQRPFFWHFPHYTNQGSRPSGAMRDDSWIMVEFYDLEKAELYNLAADISELRDLAAEQPHRLAAMRKALAEWREKNGTQANRPNPDYDPVQYRALYQEVNSSRFNPFTATDEQWKQIWAWRKGMDSASAAARRPN
jgi:arylsulfatase A